MLHSKKESKLEKLCPFSNECAVDLDSSEICRENYEQCKIYQELRKYKRKYLKDTDKRNRLNVLQSGLCPFTDRCSESNFGDEDICKNDYESCRKYKRFKKEDMSKYIERVK